ncbi:MAG: alpha/beta hydrolase [Candidatus Nanopelagicales bacterium]|jgi:acetyl esterase|nr:alpha/beta hydrolase [Candidatus Nanopelagicales bacterium]MCU0297891.1 alpha/beta hydrolase [Candidatus Nanopelagicales bacterium]
MSATLNPSQRAMRAVIRGLGMLPEPAQRMIAGKPVEIDGQRLLTEVQMALRLLNAIPGSSFEDLPIPQARAQIDAEAMIFGDCEPVEVIEDILIPTRAGSVPGRVYIGSASSEPGGAVAYFHGGGWVVGGLTSTDSVCRFLAAHTDLVVVSVDYRLAPEHPFPAAVEDAIDAYRWLRSHPQWGATVAVAGDSAGGNLSAVVSGQTLDDELGPPDFQLLFFPVTDASTKHHSYELFSEGYFLTEKQMDWYFGHYVPDPADRLDPRVSPLLGDLRGHPPAHVAVSGFDVLRDEGIAYAHKLREAGVPTTLQVVEGHIHAFVNATGVGKWSKRALAEAVHALSEGMQQARR